MDKTYSDAKLIKNVILNLIKTTTILDDAIKTTSCAIIIDSGMEDFLNDLNKLPSNYHEEKQNYILAQILQLIEEINENNYHKHDIIEAKILSTLNNNIKNINLDY